MADRPYTVLSCCMSLDGHIDDASGQRLILSGVEDADRVDALRADADAILVGAGTIRSDDPRLIVRSPARRDERIVSGRPASPTKVTLTRSGQLPADARFFTVGEGERLVYAAAAASAELAEHLGSRATVVSLGPEVLLPELAYDLGVRGAQRLLVEGGSATATAFLREDLVDELQLSVAPFFVGDGRAPRFVQEGPFPWTVTRRAELLEVQRAGDVVVLRYALSDRCDAR